MYSFIFNRKYLSLHRFFFFFWEYFDVVIQRGISHATLIPFQDNKCCKINIIACSFPKQVRCLFKEQNHIHYRFCLFYFSTCWIFWWIGSLICNKKKTGKKLKLGFCINSIAFSKSYKNPIMLILEQKIIILDCKYVT